MSARFVTGIVVGPSTIEYLYGAIKTEVTMYPGRT